MIIHGKQQKTATKQVLNIKLNAEEHMMEIHNLEYIDFGDRIAVAIIETAKGC